MSGIVIREARLEDLPRIAAIQQESPEGAQWEPAAYLSFECTVAEQDGEVAGFLVLRRAAPDETEILNVAVAAGSRRKGVAKTLLQSFLNNYRGECFLEVRASNRVAQKLYQALGFHAIAERRDYYTAPAESAIVMRKDS